MQKIMKCANVFEVLHDMKKIYKVYRWYCNKNKVIFASNIKYTLSEPNLKEHAASGI